MGSHTAFIMLYIHSAMTHITPAIRAQSTAYLDVLLDTAPEQVARLGWSKTLSCFFPLLGWPVGSEVSSLAAATVTTGLSFGKDAPKTRQAHIQSLEKFLLVGLDKKLDSSLVRLPPFHHSEAGKFWLPQTSNPYLSLGLFGQSHSEDPVTEDVESRYALLEKYSAALARGLDSCVKEGGQVGRVAAAILNEVMGIQ